MLAVRWLFPDTEIRIDTYCLQSGEPILVRMCGDDILEINPTTVVVHMNVPLVRSLAEDVPWRIASTESILPLSDWAFAISGPLFANRMEQDYLSRMDNYNAAMYTELKKLEKNGAFWTAI